MNFERRRPLIVGARTWRSRPASLAEGLHRAADITDRLQCASTFAQQYTLQPVVDKQQHNNTGSYRMIDQRWPILGGRRLTPSKNR